MTLPVNPFRCCHTWQWDVRCYGLIRIDKQGSSVHTDWTATFSGVFSTPCLCVLSSFRNTYGAFRRGAVSNVAVFNRSTAGIELPKDWWLVSLYHHRADICEEKQYWSFEVSSSSLRRNNPCDISYIKHFTMLIVFSIFNLSPETGFYFKLQSALFSYKMKLY